MSTKLFVGGLPWAMDNERLKQVFAEFGDVADARVILDRETGRSRGFGFVTYASDEGAEKALQLDGTEIDGRRIRVDRAQEKDRPARPAGRPRPDGGGPGGRPGGARDFGGGGGGDRPGPGAGAPPREREREGGGAPPGAGRPRGAGPGRDGPGAGAGRRDFGGDDWGGGERDRGERGRRGAVKDKGKGRGRRRGGRGGRGGGEDHDDVPPSGGGFDDFDDWD